MRIERNSHEAIIFPDDQIDISNSVDLRTEFLILLAEDYRRIVVDFSKVTSIDSSGIGKLLYFSEHLKNRQGTLVIRNIKSEYIKSVFSTFYLDQIVEIEDNEDLAAS